MRRLPNGACFGCLRIHCVGEAGRCPEIRWAERLKETRRVASMQAEADAWYAAEAARLAERTPA